MPTILAIEEDPHWVEHLKTAVENRHETVIWPDGEPISSMLQKRHFEIILLSLQLTHTSSFNLLKKIRHISPHTPIVVTSEVEKPSLATKALRGGAFDFLSKPFSLKDFTMAFEKTHWSALERLEKEEA